MLSSVVAAVGLQEMLGRLHVTALVTGTSNVVPLVGTVARGMPCMTLSPAGMFSGVRLPVKTLVMPPESSERRSRRLDRWSRAEGWAYAGWQIVQTGQGVGACVGLAIDQS